MPFLRIFSHSFCFVCSLGCHEKGRKKAFYNNSVFCNLSSMSNIVGYPVVLFLCRNPHLLRGRRGGGGKIRVGSVNMTTAQYSRRVLRCRHIMTPLVLRCRINAAKDIDDSVVFAASISPAYKYDDFQYDDVVRYGEKYYAVEYFGVITTLTNQGRHFQSRWC